MNDLDFILHLRSLGIKFWLDDDKVRFHAPQGVLTDELRTQMKERKQVIQEFLQRGLDNLSNAAPARPVLPAIARRSRGTSLPLSYAQQRLWFLEQLRPVAPDYIMGDAVRFAGPLNTSIFAAVVDEIVRRHENLRTVFRNVDGQAEAHVMPFARVDVQVADLGGLEPAERESRAREQCVAYLYQPFDLTCAPLLRCRIFRLAHDDHVVAMAMHHIVSDGWSVSLLIDELIALYDAFIQGRQSPLDELSIQYGDYALWQREVVEGGALERALAYWERQLSDMPGAMELPTDQPRTGSEDAAGGQVERTLSAALTDRIHGFGRAHKATLFMTLLSAWTALLHRYTRASDVAIGAPIANRHMVETERLIGLFLNTLVVRTRLTGAMTFGELIAQVRDHVLEAEAYRDVPFEYLVARLKPERDLGRNPFFDVMLNVVNVPAARPLILQGVHAAPFALDQVVAKVGLTLYVHEHAGQLRFELVYRRSLLSREYAACILDQLEHLLRQVVEDPDRAIQAYSLLTSRSRGRLPDPRAPLSRPSYPPVPALLREQAERAADHPAVSQGESTWTRGALHSAITALARALVARGLDAHEVVAVTGAPSMGMIASMAAVLAARGVLLTIDPRLPRERQQVMLDQARARYVLRVAASDTLELDCGGCIEVDPRSARALAGAPADVEAIELPEVRPEDPAYIFFTSGTTGVPKAVLGWHEGLSHFVHWQRDTFAIGAGDRAAQLTALSFDVVLRDVFTPLCSGATLVLPDDEQQVHPELLLAWLERERITMVHTVPTLVQFWLQHAPRDITLSSLRWAFVAGEPLTDALVSRWRQRYPDAGHIVNLYGPTETTLAKCYFVVPEPPEPGVQPVGRALPHAQALIINEAGEMCGVGEIGEISIRTPFRSLGYQNAPAENALRFVPNPFIGPEHEGDDLIYRTGDLGRYRPDGLVEIHGRVDHQVKIAGVRVEPDEVMAVLAQHPSVRACAVVALRHPRGNYALVAYVVPAASGPFSGKELLVHAATKLPAAMVPALFVPLDELPRTANGKVDRSRLPAPDWQDAAAQAPRVAPQTPEQARLAAIWSHLLDFSDVGTNESFFALGGHSLLAMRMIAEIRKAFAVDLPVRAIFEAPTIAELAARIAEHAALPEPAESTDELVADAARRHQPFPLTDVQAAFWVGRSTQSPDREVATQGYQEFELRDLDIERLQAALNRVVRRHDMLRVVMLADGRQRILDQVPDYVIAVLDLRGSSAQQRDRALSGVREQLAYGAMPCDRWPLFEVRVSYLDHGRARVHARMDALIADNWSALILAREVLWLYVHPDHELPQHDISFRDYVLAERAAQRSPDYARAQAYWMARLPELPPAPDLPLAGAQPMAQPRFDRHQFVLAKDRWSALEARASAAGISPACALLTAYAEVLAHWSRSAHFTLNVTLFNRRPVHPQVNELVGNFSSLDLLEVDFRAREPFADRARGVQKRLWQDLDHARFTGVEVMRELTRMGRASVEAVMPIVFTSTLGMPATAVGEQELPPAVYGVTQSAQVYLNHGVGEVAGSLVLRWDVLEQRFRAGVIDEMFAAYCRRLDELATGADAWTEIRTLPCGAAERWLPQAPGEVPGEAPGEVPDTHTCLHVLFERRACELPEQLAVITPTRKLSYRELHGLAVAIGDGLRALGAMPNQLVAVVMQKGWEQVAAVLGVHYAGAAYLPIDPALPRERIHYLLRNGRVACALTQTHVQERLSWPAHVHVIAVDRVQPEDTAPAPREPVQQPTDLAYVIYTSGSTGEPKGVMIDHRGAVNTIIDINRRFSVAPRDRVFGISSLSFDLSVYDVFGTLAAGATLVLPDAEASRDPEHWASCIDQHQVSVWSSVPALMEILVEWVAEHRGAALDSLRLAMLSGDWIPVSLPDRLRALVPDIELVSLGGATEASIWSILYPIADVDPSWTSIPYGTSMCNQAVYVLDEHLEPRPLWVTGELYIGGIGVARGYWDDEQKTRARFLDHATRGVLYRTGDMGRLMPDGNIEFLGREDNQVKIRGHRIELGEIEGVARQHPGVREVVAAVRQDRDDRMLIVYVVASDEIVDEEALRGHLAEHLPAYMVPAHIIALERLPLTANGKVDRGRLPAPEPARAQDAVSTAPRTAVEQTLLVIWQELLGAGAIGIHDNFFELGGDSIMAIQMLTRAARAGLGFRARHVFEHPTIAGLAAVATPADTREEPETASGEVFLTPVQRWFFEHDFADPHHWNQALLLDVVRPVSADDLRRALAAILEHHDALRARFVVDEQGWRQVVAPWHGEVPFDRVDLAALERADAQSRMDGIMAERQAGASLTHGPLIRVTLFDHGPAQPAQLLMVIHHLVVDGISWRILLEDLQLALEQLDAAGAEADIQLPPRTASFQRWARALSEAARSAELLAAADYWLSLPWSRVTRVPADHAEGQNTVASARTFATVLSPEETDALLRVVPDAYNTRINDVLMTALAQGFAYVTGSRALFVNMEGHGREALFDDIDISRTVGWFTAIFPVLLDLGEHLDPGQELMAVKEQLRQIPYNGVAYGLLRYMRDHDELAERLRALPQAEVSFDYLGRMDVIATRSTPFLAWSQRSAGPTRSPRALRRDLIEIIAVIAGGQLRTSWTYSTHVHEPATIEGLANQVHDALRALISHCLESRRGRYIPADFPLASLDAATLERLAGGSRDIEDIYQASPMQAEILRHARARTRAGAYHVQLAFTLRGALDVDAFERAWQAVVEHHPILRTGFAWAAPDRPVQIVRRHARMEVQRLDWRAVPEAELPERLARLQDQDRARGFEIAVPPLMRVVVLELADDRYRVLWSHHHLLLDGWCEPLVLRDMLAAYTAFCAGTAPVLQASAPYRDYIAWLQRQPLEPVRAFWQHKLSGCPAPVPRLQAAGAAATPADGERAAHLNRQATAALQSFARQHGLTLNIVVQGALALCLRELGQLDDVLFGMTVSGRPAELRGVESMVGLFVNSLPVRVRFPARTSVVAWLHALQSELAVAHGYQHTPFDLIRDAIGAPAEDPLVAVNLRFQNYPMDVSLQGAKLTLDDGNHHLRPGDIASVDHWHYPINLVVIPGHELHLRMDYDRTRVHDAQAEELLDRVHHALCHAPDAWQDLVL